MRWEPSKRTALWEGRDDRGLCQLLSVSTIRAQYPGCTTHPVPTLQILSTGPGSLTSQDDPEVTFCGIEAIAEWLDWDKVMLEAHWCP